jgi:hypothetical protein
MGGVRVLAFAGAKARVVLLAFAARFAAANRALKRNGIPSGLESGRIMSRDSEEFWNEFSRLASLREIASLQVGCDIGRSRFPFSAGQAKLVDD